MSPEYPTCNTPVVLIAFNRPELTRVVFERIASVRPKRLLVVADGPRPSRAGEAELCRRVRDIATNVTWPCQVQTCFSEINLGCKRRVISGLNWVFDNVEEAIVLEDDVLPDISFFRFCDELLVRYRGDSRISMISAFNVVETEVPNDWSYYYSKLTHIWGWATWRDSWRRYDENLARWPEIKRAGLMNSLFPNGKQRQFWTSIFDRMHSGTGPDTWDFQWAYTNLMSHTLSIVPRVNLVRNIGFGPDATHTKDPDDGPALQAKTLPFPLIHPAAMGSIEHLDELDGKICGNQPMSFTRRIARELKRSLLGRGSSH